MRRLPLATLLVALATAALLAVLPLSRSESCTSTSESPEVLCESSTSTLLEHEGSSVLVVLLVPAALAAIGVLRPTTAVLRGVAVALTVCVVLGAASIGLFFLPTLLAAWIAAVRQRDGVDTT